MKKKAVIAGLFIAGLMGFAGTCTFQHLSLTTVGNSKIFAGEVHNGTEANVLQHNFVVAFVDAGGSVLETQTVTPCLRSLPAGGVDFFSATSTVAAAQVTAGLARVALDNTLKLGKTAAGSATFSGVTAKRAKMALTAAGTVTNADATTLESPIVCAVAYSAAGNVMAVGTGALANLGPGASNTFSVTVLVPDANESADRVDLYVDGLKAGVPTAPSSSLGNPVQVVLGPPDPPAKVGFTVQPPASTTSATAMASIVVAIQDASGATVTSSTRPVTLGIGNNAGPGGVLTCTSTLTVAAVNGLATFTGCKIDKIGTGYTLTASSAGLASATSNAFNITLGAASQVVFTTQPGGGTGGTAWGAQPVAAIKDAGGNTVTTDNASTVTLAIGNNAGPGGVLACTTNPVTVVAGVATFAGCKIDKIGTGYTVTATSGALTVGTSAAFNVTLGAAAKVGFTTQPGGGTGGTAWGTQPVAAIQDAGGNTVTTDNASTVTLAILNNAGPGGVLTCTANPKTVVLGVATFAGCKIDKIGTGYTVTATSGALTVATSSAFNITLGAASQLVITTQPSGTATTNVAFVAQPVIKVEDAGGNVVTTDSASTVTLSLNGVSGGPGTLSCTSTGNLVNTVSAGVTTFAGCKIVTAGTYTITATSNTGGVTATTTTQIVVS